MDNEKGTYGSFVTLTYDDENLPVTGSISKKEHQVFIRALRDKLRLKGVEIRYFMCGEYGETEYHQEDPWTKIRLGPGRPHYHYIIFGYDFPDKTPWKIHRGNQYYRSAELEEVWTKGFSTVGAVTPETAAYTARYVTKKITGEDAEDHYTRLIPETGEYWPIQPEFCLMSLKPGIGADWFSKYGSTDVYDSGDFIVINGKKYVTPRFYDRLLEDLDERELHAVQKTRKKKAAERAQDATRERLAVREEVQQIRLNKLKRGYEEQ